MSQLWSLIHFDYSKLGVIIFGSDQEVGELMEAVKRRNATGMFTWIGSDGWGGRGLAYHGKEEQVNNIDKNIFKKMTNVRYLSRMNDFFFIQNRFSNGKMIKF